MQFRTKVILFAIFGSIVLPLLILAYNLDKAKRVWRVVNLFEAEVIDQNFRAMFDIFPSHRIGRGSGPIFTFERAPQPLPENFTHRGKTLNTRKFLEETQTTGFVVIKDDKIIFENYYRGNSERSLCISWSMGKSVVSAMMGLAIEDGFIKSIEEPVTKYLPELKMSAYKDVSIKDVLQMSSGVRFSEDYADFNSDITRMGRVLALGSSMNDFVLTLNKRENPPGTFHHYSSADTQVLGILLRKVTGKPLSKYLEEKIWSRIGMEADAFWLTDDTGMELAFGTLNATLRDFARFGRLYLHRGNWQGRTIVPEAWVQSSITPDAPHLQPGPNPASDSLMGYGYQWWLPEHPDNDFLAIGIYNQFLYVSRKHNVVIAKTSAYVNYTEPGEEIASEAKSVSLFQSIARNL